MSDIKTKEKVKGVRALDKCYRHLRDYIDRSNYIVRRANPYAVAKEQCDWCNRPGYDYFVIERLANERRKKND